MNLFPTHSYKLRYFTFLFLTVFLAIPAAHSQITVYSTSGYSVTVDVRPVSLVNKVCSTGNFTYDLQVHYATTFSPLTAPNLYTLEGTYICKTLGSFFLLPVYGGSGDVIANTQTYFGTANCSTATPADIACNNYVIRIHGVGIDDQYINGSLAPTPLAVKLASFDARMQDKGVFLTWTTTNEAGNSDLSLERSNNTTDWIAIYKANNDNQSGGQHYQYTDQDLLSGTAYYRVRETDKDGSVSYSRIIGVKSSGNDDISIYPNPSNGNALHVSGMESAVDWTVTITNMLSKEVMKSPVKGSEIALPAGIPTGMYFLQFTNSSTGQTKLIKFTRN